MIRAIGEKYHVMNPTSFKQSMTVPEAFFDNESKKFAQAGWAIVRRFHQGGRFLIFGNDPWAADIQHVFAEAIRPIMVGKVKLPTQVLHTTNNPTRHMLIPTTKSRNAPTPFAHQLRVRGQPQDIALGFSCNGNCRNVAKALQQARHMGMLTLGLTSDTGGLVRQIQPDFCFIVPDKDPMVIQATQEMFYRTLWELIYAFCEGEDILRSTSSLETKTHMMLCNKNVPSPAQL